MTVRKILVLNGPNLDMLGVREPEIYGHETLEALENEVMNYGSLSDIEVVCQQSNSEGKLIGRIHEAPKKYDGIVYNPGAHTHYSYALRDAVASIDIPVVEVHLSDIDDREPFRSVSVIAPACIAQVRGQGVDGYCRAIDILQSNRGLQRLGEGFEASYPAQQQIIIGGVASSGSASPGGMQGEGATVEAAPAVSEDLTAPYREAIDGINRSVASIERLSLLRRSCSRIGAGAMMVRDNANIEWLTAIEDVFDDERAHCLLVTANLEWLHSDSRYAHALRQAASRLGSDLIIDEERIGAAQFVFNTLTLQGQESFEGKLGFEDTATYAEFVKLVELFDTTALLPTTEVVANLRAVKDPGELLRMRAAQAITDAAFSHIVGYMKPGMTEREVQLELDSFMEHHGADGLAFRTIVACGMNGADPHAIPGSTRLEAGQCVVMDFGAKAFGYCSDMTRTVFLGQPDEELTRAWQVLRSTNEAIEGMLRPGITGKEAHEAAEAHLTEGGFGAMMGHGLGHGVGLEVHELPVLNSQNSMPLVEGNVVTVEPGIYAPGRFGMRLEDFGVITAEGFDVFTQSTHEMVII